MLRPLLLGDNVKLVFEEPPPTPTLVTDESKVSQILRNCISNAVRFTEQGEVRVYAEVCGDDPQRTAEVNATNAESYDGRLVRFGVDDTGIGIRPEDQSRIFEEFTQLPHRLQGRVMGTGLGI